MSKRRAWLCGRDSKASPRNYGAFARAAAPGLLLPADRRCVHQKMREGRRVVPAYPACLPFGSTVPVGCLSPAVECEQSRTSVDESGNRHREVLSES